MLGAIIGDMVGSKYEFDNIKTKEFPLFSPDTTYTDDTIMTIAVARALMRSREETHNFQAVLIEEMQALGRKYPYPTGGYGMRFSQWLRSSHPEPYHSFGNGSAMRVSPCGLIAVELYEALSLAKASAEVTHNHPEGIKGAQAVAGAVFLARQHKDKQYIADFIKTNFYDLDFTLDQIRDSYRFNETCQGTVPQAIVAFLESASFEDAIRNAVSLGGDCDTLTAITGSIAWTYYAPDCDFESIPEFADIISTAKSRLPEEFLQTIETFHKIAMGRNDSYHRTGMCASPIPHHPPLDYDYHFSLIPAARSTDGIHTLRQKIETISHSTLLADFCSCKRHINILSEHGIDVMNYNDYVPLINLYSADHTTLYTATLEECLIYLTYLWRADYMTGGYPDFDDRHRKEIRTARMRIVDLLFFEL